MQSFLDKFFLSKIKPSFFKFFDMINFELWKYSKVSIVILLTFNKGLLIDIFERILAEA